MDDAAYLVNFHRTETRFSELPEHLRYHPLTVPNPCPAVLPRYLLPRAPSPKPAKPSFQPQTTFGPAPPKPQAGPRYLQPRAQTPEPRKPTKYLELPEYQYHLRVATAAGFGHAASKLLEWHNKPNNPEESPRARVAQHRESNKRISSWRGVATNAPSRTFDEVRQRNQHLAAIFEQAIAMKQQKNKTPSVVSDYCRHGTPIRHHTMGPYYVSKRKKDFDPKWTSGGGAGGGRWYKSADKGPTNKSLVRCESRVKELRSSSKERIVSRAHVPRVAMLAPSYSLQRWESSLGDDMTNSEPVTRQDSGALGAPSPAPRFPAADIGRRESSASMGRSNVVDASPGVEIIEGPVTVSVPKGAIVRISSSAPQA
jgi:hypothetical protein